MVSAIQNRVRNAKEQRKKNIMDATSIAKKIIGLKDEDEKLRRELIRKGTLSKGYNQKMEALHARNAKELQKLMEKIGYPTAEKVGQEASDAAWLVIQHSIGQPNFMKKAAILLEEAVHKNKANPKHLAYLTDRIAVFEGKPQHYGTQFDWDKNGIMNPNQYDDRSKVNQRRKALGLNTLEEQTLRIRERVKKEKEHPPKDVDKRKQDYDLWRRTVGWIK